MILDDLIFSLTLNDTHREAMRKRGFSDAAIERARWRSCQMSNIGIIDELTLKYGIQAMVEAKLCVENPRRQGEFMANSQLLDSNVLIPYMNAEGSVLKVRPHKLGFAGDGSLVYQTAMSFENVEYCVIAESEFKAEASVELGVPAIGIPGIASMSGKNLDYFIGVLEKIQCKEFIILFDTEVKNNPEFPNYKPDWRRRYDTQIYAYAMCQKIVKTGINCRIAELPLAWMEQGKIDIDGALAQKRTPDEYYQAVVSAQSPSLFLNALKASMPAQHFGFLSKRIQKYFHVSPIIMSGGAFCIKEVDKEGVETVRKICNCTFSIINVYEALGEVTEESGVMRDIVITDEYGIESRPIPIDCQVVAFMGKMKEWLASRGNYIWYGKESDATLVWDYIFAHDDGNIVYLINRSGFVKEFNCFLFGNVCIRDSVSIEPDVNGIFWLNDIGIKAAMLSSEEALPEINMTPPFDMKLFTGLMTDTCDGQQAGTGKAMIAWVLAVIFMKPIVEEWKLFPIFFLYGNRGSGKTTIMRWLLSFFGMTNMKSLINSTPVGITRYLSFYSNLPVVFDDWRDSPEYKKYITYMLGIYNRQSGAKGIKSSFGIQHIDIRACLAIMGEDLISDSGLQTRCYSFYVTAKRKRECYHEMEAIQAQASYFTYELITKRYDELVPKVLEKIRYVNGQLRDFMPTAESRLLINHSIFLGTYLAVMGEDQEIWQYFTVKTDEVNNDQIEADMMHTFFSAVATYHRMYSLPHHVLTPTYDGARVWVDGLIQTMKKGLNDESYTPAKGNIIKKHLRALNIKEDSEMFVIRRGELPASLAKIIERIS